MDLQVGTGFAGFPDGTVESPRALGEGGDEADWSRDHAGACVEAVWCDRIESSDPLGLLHKALGFPGAPLNPKDTKCRRRARPREVTREREV